MFLENIHVITSSGRLLFNTLKSIFFKSFLKRILVFPAASSPNIKILISLFPKIFDSNFPMLEYLTPLMGQLKRINKKKISLNGDELSINCFDIENVNIIACHNVVNLKHFYYFGVCMCGQSI